MSLTRRELDKIYEEVRSRYRRKNRDKDIVEGIDTLYKALSNYTNCNYISAKD